LLAVYPSLTHYVIFAENDVVEILSNGEPSVEMA